MSAAVQQVARVSLWLLASVVCFVPSSAFAQVVWYNREGAPVHYHNGKPMTTEEIQQARQQQMAQRANEEVHLRGIMFDQVEVPTRRKALEGAVEVAKAKVNDLEHRLQRVSMQNRFQYVPYEFSGGLYGNLDSRSETTLQAELIEAQQKVGLAEQQRLLFERFRNDERRLRELEVLRGLKP